MASQSFSNALDALESLIAALSMPLPEHEKLVGETTFYVLAEKEINGMLTTRNLKEKWTLTAGSLVRLLAARRKLGGHHARRLGARLDTLIDYTAREAREPVDAASFGPTKSPGSWHIAVVSCKYNTDSATTPFRHAVWRDGHCHLPVIFEWETAGKTFHVFSGKRSSYRTEEGQRSPLVTMSTSPSDLKLHLALRPPEPQVYRESFSLAVASEEHRQILVGHLVQMGARMHKVLGGQ
ncbi:MAG: hypothetical protein LQ346_003096 [Caloplaca aetnensis]|nr:MAG: hypothetical protein LQ346_003096 [Caloplaca aetnensis]